MNFTAQEIADMINGLIVGNPMVQINSVAKIDEGVIGNLCFLANEKYINHLYSSNASIIIISKSIKPIKNVRATLIKVEDAYTSFSKLLEIYNRMKFDRIEISEKAEICTQVSIAEAVYIGAFTSICTGAIIGKNVKIHPSCYIGENVTIGDNTIIFPNVCIYHNCKIGANNIIHSGAIIGADGFGFASEKDHKYKKISQIGNVEISDNVEIGANTTIDRATMGSTKIENGVKLDNLIQVGHNVSIGKNTVMAAQSCIAGSSKIGENCMIGGQVAIAGHLTIADNVKIAGQSGVAASITQNGAILQGPMAFNIKEFQRSYIIFKRLPEMYKTLNTIKNNLDV